LFLRLSIFAEARVVAVGYADNILDFFRTFSVWLLRLGLVFGGVHGALRRSVWSNPYQHAAPIIHSVESQFLRAVPMEGATGEGGNDVGPVVRHMFQIKHVPAATPAFSCLYSPLLVPFGLRCTFSCFPVQAPRPLGAWRGIIDLDYMPLYRSPKPG